MIGARYSTKKYKEALMQSFFTCIALMLLFLLFDLPEQAWALQPHGEPEGLYVHQMAHVLFVAALAYLYLHTRSTPDLVSRGWRYLRLFCLLAIAWNIIAFTGHIVHVHHENRPPGAAVDILESLYILTRMDHFLYVPALFALMISLRTFYREAKEGKAK